MFNFFNAAETQPAYKKDMIDWLSAHPNELPGVVGIVKHKENPGELISDYKKVNGKFPDKCFVLLNSGDQDITTLTQMVANFYVKHTKIPTKWKTAKRQHTVRVGDILHADDPVFADEYLHSKTLADILTKIFPKESFDNDETAEQIIDKYFSLIDYDEAKKYILEAYPK